MKEKYAAMYDVIGRRIAYYRKIKHLTQEELAAQIGRHPAYISHMESQNSKKSISLGTLFDIAAVLKIPPAKLLDPFPEK